MWLLVGLGNPGPRYRQTRHNVGFDVIERLSARWEIDPDSRVQLDALVGEGTVCGAHCVVVRPQSYMNRSGLPVSSLATLYGVPADHVLVVHDDLDLPFPSLRCKRKGGHGGHNGLRDIIRYIEGGFPRLRVGIGRPAPGTTVVDHVLGGWTEEEEGPLAELIDLSADAIEAVLTEGLTAAMNRFNVRLDLAPPAPAPSPAPPAAPPPGPATRPAPDDS